MDDTRSEKVLTELEKRFWQALQDRDLDAVTQLTDFPCIVTGAAGVHAIDQHAFAQMLEKQPYTLDRVELAGEPRVRMLNDDVGVVAYQVRELLTVEGKPVTLDATDSSTWIRRNGAWRCAHHTEAISGDAFGRDRIASRSTPKPRAKAGELSEDERAIRGLIETWMNATRAHDLDTVLGLMADDVVFLTAGQEPFGKEAFAAEARGIQEMRVEGSARVEELEVLGDRAWCRTHLTVTMTPPGGEPKRRSGYALTIFRKQPDGAWVLARDANVMTEEGSQGDQAKALPKATGPRRRAAAR
jgi:uncharacterized protein (TIGR02246 family)